MTKTADGEIAISIENVSRMFKRYTRSRYRVLDALGFKLPKNAYDEFWALRDVSIQIARGERVALIGRNGAGKSTLLNIVCGRLQPTGGKVKVRGRIQALMELGTGFHPEFTGRENILATLAYQGFGGAEAAAKVSGIIDFAELQDFIDQPVKTYSAGMFARLAFSAATATIPDILIIDEILGAGDAYFASKCNDRMRQLTMETGATVLFVSHDITSVQRLCERAIWVERGRIIAQGTALEVSKSYTAAVQAQDEERLKHQTRHAIARLRRNEADQHADDSPLIVALAASDSLPPKARHPIRRMQLTAPGFKPLDVRIGEPMDNDQSQGAFVATDQRYSTWSAPGMHLGEFARVVERTNPGCTRAAVYFRATGEMKQAPLSIEIEHCADHRESLVLEINDSSAPSGWRRLGALGIQDAGGRWRTDVIPLGPIGAARKTAEAVPARVEPKAAANAIEKAPDDTTIMATVDDGKVEAGKKQPARDKWDTEHAAFTHIKPVRKSTLQPQYIFDLAEPIAFVVGVKIEETLPSLWCVASLLDAVGNRIALIAHKVDTTFDAGEHELVVTLTNPNLRQGHYMGTFELLLDFDYSWNGMDRIPYLCLWDRCVFFDIDEKYRGALTLGIVSTSSTLQVRASDGTLSAPQRDAGRPWFNAPS